MLEGMRIVSFCHYLQGPAGAQYLADMGADVIKVEPPQRRLRAPLGRRQGVHRRRPRFYLAANRNKRSLAVDLKHPDGKAVIVPPARAAPTC